MSGMMVLTREEAERWPAGSLMIIVTGRYRRCWRLHKTDFRYYGKSWYAVALVTETEACNG